VKTLKRALLCPIVMLALVPLVLTVAFCLPFWRVIFPKDDEDFHRQDAKTPRRDK
tara:strand:- start:1680 stop:1844 length:165 start_codon:yes stop_codon:yes gene_type:complete